MTTTPDPPKVVVKMLLRSPNDNAEFVIPETVNIVDSKVIVIPGMVKPLCFLCYPDKIVELKN